MPTLLQLQLTEQVAKQFFGVVLEYDLNIDIILSELEEFYVDGEDVNLLIR